jgi:hypothetical protein
MRKEDFYTVPKANAGVKMPLTLDDGSDTGHWLMVRGTDSEAFRKARFDAARAVRDIPEGTTEVDRAKVMDEVILDNLVALVAGWSFDEPLTPESVREFLTNAPQVANAIDSAAADRSRFFGIASETSKSTRKRS